MFPERLNLINACAVSRYFVAVMTVRRFIGKSRFVVVLMIWFLVPTVNCHFVLLGLLFNLRVFFGRRLFCGAVLSFKCLRGARRVVGQYQYTASRAFNEPFRNKSWYLPWSTDINHCRSFNLLKL